MGFNSGFKGLTAWTKATTCLVSQKNPRGVIEGPAEIPDNFAKQL